MSASESRIRLAVTLGDPRGIGPEVVDAAIRTILDSGHAPAIVLVGPSGTTADETPCDGRVHTGRWRGGAPSRAGGHAGRAIEHAVRLALAGDVDAIVTGPVDKKALNAAGFTYRGHTEMLAALTNASRVGMLMTAEETALGGPLRVLLATTHMALRKVPDAVTTGLIVEQARLLDDSLREEWGIERPRLALCALNPHASDGGLFGDEEATVLRPAVEQLVDAGTSIVGPVSADTVFVRAVRGEFDAVVAPYHDVGMSAFKTASFGRGVNVTLGLPFVRTSPDHGTALDIAGRGLADTSSMLEALRLAVRLARTRRSAALEAHAS